MKVTNVTIAAAEMVGKQMNTYTRIANAVLWFENLYGKFGNFFITCDLNVNYSVTM